MSGHFNRATLDLLRNIGEVTIHPGQHPSRGVVIWIVVCNDDAFVRSYHGAAAKWYAATISTRLAVLKVEQRNIPVQVEPVSDPSLIASVTTAYLTKYASSPYAAAMVAPEILSTTLRLEPR